MQETILDGEVIGQDIAYGYTTGASDTARPRTGKKLPERQKEVGRGNKEEN